MQMQRAMPATARTVETFFKRRRHEMRTHINQTADDERKARLSVIKFGYRM